MIDQPDLFAAAAADEAIRRAAEHADPDWKIEALAAGRRVAARLRLLTSDDVRREIRGADTHEPRALGAVMRRLASEGVIVATDRYAKSGRVEAHDRPMRLWRSLDTAALPE